MLMKRFDRVNQRVVSHPSYLLVMLLMNIAMIGFGVYHGLGLAVGIGIVLGIYYGYLLWRQVDRIIELQDAKKKAALGQPANDQ